MASLQITVFPLPSVIRPYKKEFLYTLSSKQVEKFKYLIKELK